jgi:hypothetical protein
MTELELLVGRWRVLSEDETVSANTRRVLRICLEDVEQVMAHELMSERHMSKEHDE